MQTLSTSLRIEADFGSAEVIFSMQSDSPAQILETKYPPSLMLESLNTKLLDGEFAYSQARVVSLKEVNILRPPKVSLGVDTVLDSELLKLPAILFISLILI